MLVIEFFVKTSHGVDAVATFGENIANTRISKFVGLKLEQGDTIGRLFFTLW